MLRNFEIRTGRNSRGRITAPESLAAPSHKGSTQECHISGRLGTLLELEKVEKEIEEFL